MADHGAFWTLGREGIGLRRLLAALAWYEVRMVIDVRGLDPQNRHPSRPSALPQYLQGRSKWDVCRDIAYVRLDGPEVPAGDTREAIVQAARDAASPFVLLGRAPVRADCPRDVLARYLRDAGYIDRGELGGSRRLPPSRAAQVERAQAGQLVDMGFLITI